MKLSKLEQLGNVSTVVADTGDINVIRQYQPEDATTNPSLLLKAATLPEYRRHIDDAISYSERDHACDEEMVDNCIDKLAVNIGQEILDIVPG